MSALDTSASDLQAALDASGLARLRIATVRAPIERLLTPGVASGAA